MNKIFLRVFLLILSFVSITGNFPQLARAESSGYSNALYDLQKDKNFRKSDYIKNSSDHSLELISIAEGDDQSLYVYVYQPSATEEILASSINIGLSEESIDIQNYALEYINSDSVFFKYKVCDLTVSEESTRYYDITGIYRPWNSNFDEPASGDDQIINEVVFDVSALWTVKTINGKPSYHKETIETIKITDKYVGFVRYKAGFHIIQSACDSHFVAFSTNKPIDELLEAKVYYQTQSYIHVVINSQFVDKEEYGKSKDEYAYLTDKDKYYSGEGLFKTYNYYWNEIETVDEFFKSVEGKQEIFNGAVFSVCRGIKVSTTAKNEIKTQKWVLRFAETPYDYTSSSIMSSTEQTLVSNVSILRLKFKTDGITYDLGVIDNKQTGSREPITETTYTIRLTDDFRRLLVLLLFIACTILFAYEYVEFNEKQRLKRNSKRKTTKKKGKVKK